MIDRFMEWLRLTFCRHHYLVARFKIVEEIGYAYEECASCGKEFYD